MKVWFVLMLLLWNLSACVAQPKSIVGGGCDGCDLLFAGMPSTLSHETVIGQNETGELLELSGVIYKKDGRTPAPNIILYIYHTDNDGFYKAAANQQVATRHGRLRGWMKTNDDGAYKFTTVKPAHYPSGGFPAHIHPTVKEPDKNEYYLDDFEFEGDKFHTAAYLVKLPKRGGNGIVKLTKNERGVWTGKRDIVLGLNIPNYP